MVRRHSYLLRVGLNQLHHQAGLETGFTGCFVTIIGQGQEKYIGNSEFLDQVRAVRLGHLRRVLPGRWWCVGQLHGRYSGVSISIARGIY